MSDIRFGYAAVRTKDGYVTAVCADTGDAKRDLEGLLETLGDEAHYIIRDRPEQLRESLFDYYQFHSISSPIRD